MKTVTFKAKVLRGFITRMEKEESWEESLTELPAGTELVDADAVPYYIETPDGWKEYYGFYVPEDVRVARLADEFCERPCANDI